MMIRIMTMAATLLSTVTGATMAQALERLPAVQAEAIKLGATRGWAYYVVEPDGYHLDATLFPPGRQAPVRVNAVVSRDQSINVTVPGDGNVPARNIVFVRSGGRLVVGPQTQSH